MKGVIDAKILRFQLKKHQDSSTFLEAFLQIALAITFLTLDVVILNKVDLVSPHALQELEKDIYSINSLANIIHSVSCQVDMSIVLDCKAYDALYHTNLIFLPPKSIRSQHVAHLEQLLEENKSLTTKDLHDSGVRSMCICDSQQLNLDFVLYRCIYGLRRFFGKRNMTWVFIDSKVWSSNTRDHLYLKKKIL
uniref:CobW/HypB/UreG nucleotide-binding domain-containing protein n=1 Tax=Lactuca sativa TaxID=4236 RepID=A0A9R1VDB0_LACSA|nr:hypothetical protein LSAT_V11C500274370 [Lactuca sativa]